MKKLTSIFLCIVMAVVATVALTGCKKETKKSAEQSMIDDIGGCSETYTGTLSEEQYSSSDEAMPAKNNTNLGLAPCFQANTLFRDRLIFVY